MTFEVKGFSNIMDEMEYSGIRFAMNAVMGKLVTPMKIDISTGDIITPRAIEYHYKLLLEDRFISLWSYNLETILAEKLQTVLHTLWESYQKKYPYASEISYENIMESIKLLWKKI